MVEQAHKQALYKLDDEKRNHGEFMKKSDEFTNLLEQERERSVCESNDGEKLLVLQQTASSQSLPQHLAAWRHLCWPSLQRFGDT